MLSVWSRWLAHSDQRREAPWLALVAVPLAMVGSGLTAFLLDSLWPPLLAWPPPLLAAWWWGPRPDGFRWARLLAVQEGAFGIQWGLVGSFALATYPNARLVVGCLWAGSALLVVAVFHWNRRRVGNTDPGHGW
ncbi:MAG: hypothetical protein ACYDAY_11070 [Candidatus Dormibacteria bacterium]